MHKLVSVSEMQAIEKQADESGLSYSQMMEKAGTNLAEVISDEFGFLQAEGALGLVGSGNNGGDTLVALAQLAKDGWKASAYLVVDREAQDALISRLEEAGGEVYSHNKDLESTRLIELLSDHGVLLDGVFGTGVRLPLRGKAAQVLEKVRTFCQESENPPYIVAVDCPSGIDCNSGESAPEVIPADITVTMAAIKIGMLNFPAYQFIGDLRVVDIGLGDELQTWNEIRRFVIDDAEHVRKQLPDRPLDSHKGTFGTAFVVAGSINYTGAAYLAGKAAYRVGVGLVTLAVPNPLHLSLSGQFPEATWILLPHEMGVIAEKACEVLKQNVQRSTAVLLGPGFGLEDTTRDFMACFLKGDASKKTARSIGFVKTEIREEDTEEQSFLPDMVIDADGLKLLAKIPGWYRLLPSKTVLTPHPGEMAVLTELQVSEIQSDRIGVAEKYARKWGHVVVLKGANTVIADPDGTTVVVPIATPALARAGTGDVLAGAIVGLRAQGVDAFQAAIAGVWIHGMAGYYAADRVGSIASVMAGDVLDSLVDVMQYLQ